MTLAENPRLRQFFLSALYLAQGVPTGFVAIALAAFLAQQGASVAEIAALLAVTWLPWGCKVLYGPVLDRYAGSAMGRRRPWMLVAQGGMALTLCAMLATPGLDETLWLLAAMMFVHNLFGALLDVATDAAAVDLLGVQERGRANGLMWTGKLAGLALGGAGLGTVLAYAGLRPALALMLAFLVLTMTLPLLVRERPGDRRLARLA
ncbi:MAG: MFS transporter, partial [Rhodothermales bacterium]|nr:MFS transporter [Rhodothermales bacterium]